MKRVLFVTILIAVIAITGCSFDSRFLQPHKIPKDKKAITIKTKDDSLLVTFSGENHQPTFANNDNNIIPINYNIDSRTFKSTSGNLLHGWLLSPINEASNGITILHFHGNAGSILSNLNTIAPLVAKGFKIFMFDYSGFGYSEGKATRKNVLEDAESALEYVTNIEELANDKLVIYGQSLGGHLSPVVASENQSKIDGLVIEGAFSSHKDIAGEFMGFIGRIFTAEGYSAKESIKEFHKPVLIVHSTEDQMIPVKMGKLLYENANEPKQILEITKGHLAGPKYYTEEIANKIIEMLE